MSQGIKQENTFTRSLSKLVVALNSLGTILIFGLMVLINLDVFSRFLFNAPIDGVTEMVELSIVAIVFLQLGDAVRSGRLTRSDGLFSRLLAAKPNLGHMLAAFYELCGAFFFSAILVGSYARLLEAWERGYYAGNEGLFVMPVWPVRLILVVGCVTVILVFLSAMVRHLSQIGGSAGPQP